MLPSIFRHYSCGCDRYRRVGRDVQPGRIQGSNIPSNMVSLGVSLVELALGRFSFSEDQAPDDPDLEAL